MGSLDGCICGDEPIAQHATIVARPKPCSASLFVSWKGALSLASEELLDEAEFTQIRETRIEPFEHGCNKVIFSDVGHIFFIAPKSDELLETLARWTVQWILRNEIPVDTTIYTCASIDEAEASIAIPLAHGLPPTLIVVDHGAPDPEITAFGEKLRMCVPETWVIELVDDKSWLPADMQHAFLVRKPVRSDDWDEVLSHVFLQARTPQWSRSIRSADSQ